MAHWQEALQALRTSFLLLCLPLVITGLQDNRCYLENGASSETFFVPEDLPVGGTIGKVRVVGDPRPPSGSIALRLKEPDSPVAIAPGSKNLTLRRPLDKEGIDGPSSVFVSLVCERLGGALDPGFVIPVNIRVTDANDNAPVFINAPYVLNISEVTVVGTRVLQGVHAVDNDQQGPFSSVRYSVLPGPHSDFFDFENELEGTLVLKKPLDYESLKTFDVNIRAQDHGDPPKSADTVLTVHVIDADDQNPRFLDDRYSAAVVEPALKGATLRVKPRDIKAFDQDEGIGAPIFYTWNGIGSEYSLFRLDRVSGKVMLGKNLEERDLETPAVLVIRATQQDNPDRYALATLTVSRHYTKGIKFLHPIFNIRASEALSPGAIVATLANNRPGHHLKYFVSDQNILKTFALNTLGELSLKEKLDYETKQEYIFKVFTTDGRTNDSSVVNITVDNVNEWEPRFRYPHYEFFVPATGLDVHDLVGRVEAADGDRGDKLTLSLGGPDAHMFFITPGGEIRLRNNFKGNMATLTVTAVDSGEPPKKATVPVTVHFSGGTAGVMSTRGGSSGSAPMLLAGLGTILLVLSFVVALLVAYICKVKRHSSGEQPPLPDEKRQVSNPVFGGDKSRPATAVAMGGVPSEPKSRIPSPKVHPAPQPPGNPLIWPPGSTRVKKLSWGDDKTESSSTENLDNLDAIPRVLDNSNLTVYF